MSSEQNNDQDQRSPKSTDQDPAARHRRLLGALTLMLLASWLLMLAPLPFSLLSGATGLVALVLLIALIVRSVKAGRRGTAVMAAVIGVPVTALIVLISLVTLVFYGPMSELQECRSTAITERALAQCNAQAQESQVAWLSDLLGG